MVTQVYRFAMGKQESADEAVLIDQLATKFRGSNRSFQQLLLDFTSDRTFGYRRDE